jgi:hypothetical protein
MDKKSLARFEVKDETKGEVEAVFATLNVKDHDGDVTVPGAFDNGAEVVISAYNHKSWEGALPVGKGVISEVGNEVVMKGQFFLNTTAGRDTFEVVKQLGGRQEWSYGFNVDESEHGEFEGKSARILKKMTVHEVSPVLRGAGLGTRTTHAKSLKDEVADAVGAVESAIESAERVVALRAEKGKDLSNVNVESLDGLRDAVKRLDALLNVKASEDEGPNDEDINSHLAALAVELEWL